MSLTATAATWTAVAVIPLAQESSQHSADPGAESLDGGGIFFPHDADGGSDWTGGLQKPSDLNCPRSALCRRRVTADAMAKLARDEPLAR